MDIPSLIKKKPYEKVLYVLRRHPFTFLGNLALFLVMLIAPLVLILISKGLYPTLLDNEVVYAAGILLGSIYYLTTYLIFFIHFVDYYLDLWIVTNDRIIDIEQLGLFSRTISELDLFRIQDVTSDIKGFFPTMFNYGDLTIKTASSNIHIVFRNIADPNNIREHLIKLSDEDRRFHYKQDNEENS
ncbi:PH domain-containing protein [Candidatus Nomurabacteria bacterium]|nr:PH domain-containing protein [Candidatus Nomurabacteria bacterium]